jgi:hypothetical protein
MVIDHHDIHAELFCFGERLVAGGAAVDGDEKGRAAPRQRADRLGVGAVALEASAVAVAPSTS